MCKMLRVSRSGYYAWQNRAPSPRSQRDEELLHLIRRIHLESRRTYGSPRIYEQLKSEGIFCGRHRVARLMKINSIVSEHKRRYRRTTVTKYDRNIAENILNQNFDIKAANKAWVSDITVFWTGSGWLHLAVVMDLYSRRIIGWAMQGRMTEGLVINSLQMALISRKIERTLIYHSDQGSQYTSDKLRAIVKEHSIICSMSRKGNCYDNAVAESFFKTIKIELARGTKFKTREQAQAAIFEYIEVFYNRKRLHSTLGYLSPVAYERQNLT